MEPDENTLVQDNLTDIETNNTDTKGLTEILLTKLCNQYEIGKLLFFSTIALASEDQNLCFQTDKGEYIAKVFAENRTIEDIEKEIEVTNKMIEEGFQHPQLYKNNEGKFITTDSDTKQNILVMDFAEGESFVKLQRPPRWKETTRIAEQTTLIHHTDYKPTDIKEKWAISNIHTLYKEASETRNFPVTDLELIRQAVAMYQSIPLDKLPHCLVHGALTKNNVLRKKWEEVIILNFSASDYLPRIHELAVMASDLLQDETLRVPEPLEVKTKYLVKLFNRLDPEFPITKIEREYLYSYTIAATAVSLMKGYSELQKTGKVNREFKLGHNILMNELFRRNY
ncbi:TPA: hypothetical protein DCP76_02220 [Patescibacteria group bacterium]|nr:hypothetical protein [Patescibacteria group bacterium]